MTFSSVSSVSSPALGRPLAELTTLRLGGLARQVVDATTEAEVVEAVRAADEAGEPLLVLGGGSNVVVADAGFPGTVVRPLLRGVRVESADACSGTTVNVGAGEPWDDFVAHTVDRGLLGLETLSGIPGSTGATPVQNVGAYGYEVASFISQVRTYDRERRAVRTFAAGDCGFAYRDSIFKHDPRWVVLAVQFQLRPADLALPIRYAELGRALGVELGARVPLADVRAAVLELRRGKGMVLDAADPDTWSVGSFFTNPVLPADAAAALPADAPRWPEGERVKTSAAWLIQHAGFERGYGRGGVSLSTKHTLALTNRGTGTTADLLALALEIRDGVRARFGVDLVPEPALVGLDWPTA